MRNRKQSRRKVLAALREARSTAIPVNIQRSVQTDESRQGVVLEFSKEWVLLARIRDGAYLEGYDVLRLDRITRVEQEATFTDFLRQHNQWPPPGPVKSFDLSDIRSIIEGGMTACSVVSVYREAKRPGELYIGVAIEWMRKSMWLLTIDPQCRWEDFMERLMLKDITQISFGGDYEKAVLEIAGPVPTRSH